MRNIKLSLEYDGTNYCGWQIQPNGTTIQGVLTDFLTRLEGKPVILHGAGRTDAGVHALNQVANFFTEKTLPCEKLKRAINGNLPLDIRVTQVEEMPMDFHSRFSSKGKCYSYQLALGETVSPFEYRYFYHYPYKLDLKAMQLGANLLVGEHDFSAFATAPETHSCVRTITKAEFTQAQNKLYFQIEGNGFLRYMVRTVMGTLLDVGRGKIAAEKITEILQSGSRAKAGATAPACGLTLLRVKY